MLRENKGDSLREKIVVLNSAKSHKNDVTNPVLRVRGEDDLEADVLDADRVQHGRSGGTRRTRIRGRALIG